MTPAPRVDVIVPFGNAPDQPERQANLRHVVAGLASGLRYPNYRVVVAELGPHPTHREVARDLGAEYVFGRSGGEFSPGRAANVGFGRADPADLVYFHQTDFLVASDVLDRAVHRMRRLGCPFVYPYWGEVHLCRPLSDAIRDGSVPAGAVVDVLRAAVRRQRAETAAQPAVTDGYDEIAVDAGNLARLFGLMPPAVRERIDAADSRELWGEDDREYAPFRWRRSAAPWARICRVSGGPRASAAYLCTDAAFRALGGVPELPGWGYEDLMFWDTVQRFHPYRGDRHGIRYGDAEVTLGYPLVHLWHPVGGRPGYYAAAAVNERRYHEWRALGTDEVRRRLAAAPSGWPAGRPAGSGGR